MDPLIDPAAFDLGLGPAPAAPSAPVLGESPEAQKKRRLMQIVATALAAGLGPGKGTGLLQGLGAADAQRTREQQIKDQQAQQAYAVQRQDYAAQQREFEQEQFRRQQLVTTNLDKLRTIAPTLKSKQEYDRYIDAFTSGLQGLGLRVSPNYLRGAVPYTAPDGKKTAADAVESFLKNPANKDLIASPEQLAKVRLKFDRDGDGVPELVPLLEAADIGGVQFAHGPDGMLGTYPTDTTKDQKANADGILQTLIAQAKAEGKQITPELTLQLQKQAITAAKEAGDLGPDPLLDEMRAMRIEQMKRQQNVPDMSPAQFSMANKLADDFTRDSKDFVTRAQSYGTVLAAAKDPSAAGDLSMIFAYMKFLDPGSVVREGEFATAQNTAGVPDRIRNTYNRLASGERLTVGQRADFTKQARAVYVAAKQRQDAIVRMYTQRAVRSKLPAEMVVFDFSEGVEAPAPGLGAPATGAAPAEEEVIRDPKTGKLVLKKGTP